MSDRFIKVLQVVSSMNPGGVEKNIYEYYSHIDHVRYHFDYTFFIEPNGTMKHEFEKLGSRVYQLPKKRHVFKCIHTLRKIIKKNKYDIIHIHLSYDSTIPLLASLFTKTKVRIVQYHVDLINSNFRIKVSNRLNNMFATSIFYCSDNAYYHNGFKDTRKHFYMPNVIKYENFLFNDEKRKTLRQELNIDDSTIVVGFLGRLSYEKNVPFLLDVSKELQHISNQYLTLIVGDGFDRPQLEQYVKNNGIRNVRFLGSKQNSGDYYNVFDLLMFPSFSEGFGLVLSEAEINGLIVFASSTISKQPDFMGKAAFIDLDLGAKTWAKIIDKTDVNRFEFDINKFIDANFDIKKSVKLLENEYDNLLS